MKYRLLLVLLSVTAISWAQPKMTFLETEHNFGEIAEEGGAVRHIFFFTNTGDAPLIVAGVQASCGCTTPSWTQEEVPPGGKGEIVAEYNPFNRPGRFSKSLTVRSNAQNATMELKIRGLVNPKPRSPEQDFPTEQGGLRMQSQYLQLGNLTTEKPITKVFPIYNATADSMWIADSIQAPGGVTVGFYPDTLAPGKAGQLYVTLDPGHESITLGYNPIPVRITTNQLQQATKAFMVLATVEEYFPPMSAEELEKAPRMVFESRYYDFGEIDQGEIDSTTFVLKNEGQSPLIIREARPNCACITVGLTTMEVAPGATATLTVRFNSEGRRGMQNKSVTLFSNDPLAPTQEVKFRATVKAP